ncbi:hypothetical protein [Kitasatospora sp. NPDC093102]|uniref:hypothetical protein n=1 Tax=Kitasatospora sp. NPDC093102 TaxID=3155069 RepID=UPI003448C532
MATNWTDALGRLMNFGKSNKDVGGWYEWFMGAASGTPFPKVDPRRLADAAVRVRAAGVGLNQAGAVFRKGAVSLTRDLAGSGAGTAAGAMVAGVGEDVQGCGSSLAEGADLLEEQAAQIDYAQWMIRCQVVTALWAIAQLAWACATSAGASALLIPEVVAGTRRSLGETVEGLLVSLRGAALFGAVQDAGIQAVELVDGTRRRFDATSFAMSVLGGMAGSLGDVAGRGLAGEVVAPGLLRKAAGGVLGGVAGGELGAVLTTGVQGGPWTAETFTTAAGLGGGLGLVGGLREHFTVVPHAFLPRTAPHGGEPVVGTVHEALTYHPAPPPHGGAPEPTAVRDHAMLPASEHEAQPGHVPVPEPGHVPGPPEHVASSGHAEEAAAAAPGPTHGEGALQHPGTDEDRFTRLSTTPAVDPSLPYRGADARVGNPHWPLAVAKARENPLVAEADAVSGAEAHRWWKALPKGRQEALTTMASGVADLRAGGLATQHEVDTFKYRLMLAGEHAAHATGHPTEGSPTLAEVMARDLKGKAVDGPGATYSPERKEAWTAAAEVFATAYDRPHWGAAGADDGPDPSAPADHAADGQPESSRAGGSSEHGLVLDAVALPAPEPDLTPDRVLSDGRRVDVSGRGGTGKRLPLTIHADDVGHQNLKEVLDSGVRMMVPDGLEIEMLKRRLDPGDPEYRPEWAGLTENQAWALLGAELRGAEHHGRDRQAAIHRIGQLNSEFGTSYPVDDPVQLERIADAAHERVSVVWPLVTNLSLTGEAKRSYWTDLQEGTKTVGTAMTTGKASFPNTWELGSGHQDRALKESLFGYGSVFELKPGNELAGFVGGSTEPFLAPKDTAEPPRYAAPVANFQWAGSHQEWGNVVIQWKPSVTARATYTPMNSSSALTTDGALSYTDRQHLFPLLAYGPSFNVRIALADATNFAHDPELKQLVKDDRLYDPPAHIVNRWNYQPNYFESQIHGPLDWNDVEHVVVNWGTNRHQALTEEDAQTMAGDLREFARTVGTDGKPAFPVVMGKEFGYPGDAKRRVAHHIHKVYDLPFFRGEPSARDFAVARELDRLAYGGPFARRALPRELYQLAVRAEIIPGRAFAGLRSLQAEVDPSVLTPLWKRAHRAKEVFGDVPLTLQSLADAGLVGTAVNLGGRASRRPDAGVGQG